MTVKGSVAELFGLAIQAEHNAATFYDCISKMFIDQPDVSRFWARYAEEENGHARWLINLRDRMVEDLLAQPANRAVLEQAARVTNISVENLLGKITDLQEAWELANELEHGETNIICEFLITHFVNDNQAQAFLRSRLKDHIGHLLIDFPTQFRETNARQSIKPKKV